MDMDNVNFSLQWLIDDLYKEIRELLSIKLSGSLDNTVCSFCEENHDDLAFHLGRCDAFRSVWADIQDLLDDRKQQLVEDADGWEARF